MPRLWSVALFSFLLLSTSTASAQQPKSYRIPDVNLKDQILWGSTCEGPDGFWLAFGGEDQVSGVPRTKVKVDGKWVAIRDLGTDPQFRTYFISKEIVYDELKRIAFLRSLYFRGLPVPEKQKHPRDDLVDLHKLSVNYAAKPDVSGDPDL